MNLATRNSLFDFDNLFDGFFAPVSGSEKPGTFAPRVDIRDKDGHYEITAELPGVKKEDLQVTVDNGVLTIEASTEQEDKEEKDGKLIRQERRYGKFVRTFSLGSGVQESDIKASFVDGVLKLEAPKVEPTPPEKRTIKIS